MTTKATPLLYPNLNALNNSLMDSPIGINYIMENRTASTDLLEEIIPTLKFDSRTSLSALANDLFSCNLKKINAAICELLAFTWLKENGLLSEADIGFPADWKTDDPPFEGVLRFGKTELAFDVKDGSGSGYQLLFNRLYDELSEEARAQSVKTPQLNIGYNAPTGQRWIGKQLPYIAEQFRESLRKGGFTKGRREFSIESGSVVIGLNCFAGGCISLVDDSASFVADQVFSHATEKASKLKLTNASQFMLIYVRRPHTGDSDFKKHTMTRVYDFLNSRDDLPSSFAGVLFINFEVQQKKENVPDTILWDRFGILAKRMEGIVCQCYTVKNTLMPTKRHTNALILDPNCVQPLDVILVGSCNLQSPYCTANGQAASVHSYTYLGEQYNVCAECIKYHNWPFFKF